MSVLSDLGMVWRSKSNWIGRVDLRWQTCLECIIEPNGLTLGPSKQS
jgi:hypothetical protein